MRVNSFTQNIGSLSVFYCLYNGECCEELFELLPQSLFYHCSTHQLLGAHRHFLDAWLPPHVARALSNLSCISCGMSSLTRFSLSVTTRGSLRRVWPDSCGLKKGRQCIGTSGVTDGLRRPLTNRWTVCLFATLWI